MEFAYRKVLAIAQSPLQLLGVVEWILEHRPITCDLVLVFDPRAKENKNQMQMVVDMFELSVFETIENSGRTSFLRYVNFIKSAKATAYDCALICGYGSFHEALVANLDCNVYLLDDGSDALDVRRKMLSFGPNWGIRERGLKVLRFLLLGLNIKILKLSRINFFSFVLAATDKSPAVISHSFSNVKRALRTKSKLVTLSTDAFFLDSPLEENGFIHIDTNIKAYRTAKTISGRELFYVPHREQVSSQSQSLARDCGLQVLMPKMPIEAYFLVSGIEPSVIFTTATTAVFSLKLIFPNCSFYAFDVRPNLLSKADRRSYDDFYKQATAAGVRVTSFD